MKPRKNSGKPPDPDLPGVSFIKMQSIAYFQPNLRVPANWAKRFETNFPGCPSQYQPPQIKHVKQERNT